MDDEEIMQEINNGEYPNAELEITSNEDNNYLQHSLNLINEQIEARIKKGNSSIDSK